MFASVFNSLISRRNLITSTLLGYGLSKSSPLKSESHSLKETSPLDFNNPKDNLYAFGKLWGSYADPPTYGGYQGVQFARIGTKRLIPLFGYVGFGNMQSRHNKDGSINIRGTEAGYFTDLKTGEIIDNWHNPWTNETVEVFPFINRMMRGHLTETMPSFTMGNPATDTPTLMNEADANVSTKSVPFILPWQVIGDQYLLTWEYSHEYTNPVTKDKWPKAHTTKIINPSEHFSFYIPQTIMNDRSIESSPFHAGFMRTSPWWPWMKMGNQLIDGCLFGRMHSYQITGTIEDIPKVVLDRVKRDHPDLLEKQSGWGQTNPKGTWEAYSQEVKPEIL